MTNLRRSRLAACAALAALTAACDLAAQTPPASLPWPEDRVLTDTAANGEIWAAAAGWKAGFAPGGCTFVPFLGSDAPSAPVTLRLAGAISGGEPLPLADAAPVLVDRRIAYARGDVVERFDLTPRGVEHSFVVQRLPSRAELRLDIAVATGLEHDADGGMHKFVGPRGGVRYGAATAIDARGRRCELLTAWTGTALQITVPAPFVAVAELPLVVDPLIGSIATFAANALTLAATDIAHDDSTGQFFVCYERAFSATDHDAYLAYLDEAMQVNGLLTIDFTAAYWAQPRVATVEAFDTGCVVATVSTGNVAPFKIGWRKFAGGAAPSVAPPNYTNPPAGLSDQYTPDIGGDADPSGSAGFLVAYATRDYLNVGRLSGFVLDPQGVAGPEFTLSLPTGWIYRPAVSKRCGPASDPHAGWSIVFRYAGQQTVGMLMHAFVFRGGIVRHYPLDGVWLGGSTANAGSEWDVSSAAALGGGAVYLCVETQVDAATGRGAILGHALDYTGAEIVPSATLVASNIDRRTPAVDSDGCRFAVASTNNYAGGDVDVRIATIALVNGQLLTQDSPIVSGAVDADVAPAVCAMPNQGSNQYGLAWIHHAANWAVQAQRYYGVAPGGFATRTTACGGLMLFATGSPALGETFGCGLSGATGVPGFLAGAPVSATLPGCAGCILGAADVLLLAPSLSIAVPLEPSLTGAVLSVQGMQLLAAGAPCLGQFELSNTIDITIR